LRHQPDGFHNVFNDGEVFGQTSDHFNIQVIPYNKNQPLKLDQRWGVQKD
ncbi:HIT family protein, partial [Pseudomonas aeruginosa]